VRLQLAGAAVLGLDAPRAIEYEGAAKAVPGLATGGAPLLRGNNVPRTAGIPSLVSGIFVACVVGSAAAAGAATAPVLHFDFDEGGGNVAVNAGTLGAAANGAISGARHTIDTPLATGFALEFDGDTDFVEVPDAFDYGDQLTVQAWIRPDRIDGQRAIYDDYGSPGVFVTVIDGKFQLSLTTQQHPGQGISIFAGTVCKGTWQHVAGTYDGATMKAYVNGLLVGTNTTSGPIQDNSNLATHFGADSATPSLLEFKGAVDDLRIVLDALEPAEMGVEFPVAGGGCPPAQADVDLDKGDGSHTWQDDPVIPYGLAVRNPESEPVDVTLLENVPEKTVFDPEASSAGWQCEGGGSAGASCSLLVENLAPSEERTPVFAVRVEDGTSTLWDVFNEAGADGGVLGGVEASDAVARQQVAGAAALPQLRAATEPVRRIVFESEATEYGTCSNPGNLQTALQCCIYWTFFPREGIEPGELSLRPRDVAPDEDDTRSEALYRLRDGPFRDSRGGRRATDLYYELSVAMVTAVFGDDDLLELGREAFTAWLPHVAALVSGKGQGALVTGQQVALLDAFLDALRAKAGPELAAAMDRERPRLGLQDWGGIDMDTALARLDRLTCEGFEEQLFCGEMNGDCSLSASDALIALKMAVALLPTADEADMDASGTVSAVDALTILRIAVGISAPTDSCNG